MKRLAAATVIALSVVLGGCSAPTPGPGSQSGVAPATAENLDAKGFAALVGTKGVVVLDVRTPSEFAGGHLEGAVNIDIYASDFSSKIASLDKSKSYAIYCRSGNRSKTALDQMKKSGFSQVAHLTGGIGAWQASGGKVVK